MTSNQIITLNLYFLLTMFFVNIFVNICSTEILKYFVFIDVYMQNNIYIYKISVQHSMFLMGNMKINTFLLIFITLGKEQLKNRSHTIMYYIDTQYSKHSKKM